MPKGNTLKGPTEEQMQTQLFQLKRLHEGQYPLLRWLHAIPNGGYRRPGEAGRFKAAGVESGVPDIELPVPMRGYHSLRIELKRGRDGKLSKNQVEWVEGLRELGHCVQVCYSLDAAWAAICWYLSGNRMFGLTQIAFLGGYHRLERVFSTKGSSGVTFRVGAGIVTLYDACHASEIWFHARDSDELHDYAVFLDRATIA